MILNKNWKLIFFISCQKRYFFSEVDDINKNQESEFSHIIRDAD